jgi:hypothetical protein
LALAKKVPPIAIYLQLGGFEWKGAMLTIAGGIILAVVILLIGGHLLGLVLRGGVVAILGAAGLALLIGVVFGPIAGLVGGGLVVLGLLGIAYANLRDKIEARQRAKSIRQARAIIDGTSPGKRWAGIITDRGPE